MAYPQERSPVPTVALFEVSADHYDFISSVLRADGFAVELLDPKRLGKDQSLLDYSALLIDVRGIPIALRAYFNKLLSKPECPPFIGTAPPELTESGIREAFAMGCVDFVRQPFEPYDLTARLNLALRRALKDDGVRHHIEGLEQRLQQQQRNLTEARRLQLEFSAPSYDRLGLLEVAHLLRPSQALGGDLANVLQIDARYSIFYMIDVAGHGVASALYAISVASWLQVDVKRNLLDELGRPRDPSLVVSDLNNAFPLDDSGLRYFTMTYGYIDFSDASVHYTRAGHTELIAWIGDEPVICADGDTPVGVAPAATFTDLQVDFPPGAMIVLFSDGVIDQPNPAGERYGLSRFIETLRDSRAQSSNKLLRNVHNKGSMWRSGEPLIDDQSILVLRHLHEKEPVDVPATVRVHTQTLLRSRVPATMDSASAVSALVATILHELRGPGVAAELRLAMMEAMSNIIRHGYRGLYTGTETIEVVLIDDLERVGVQLLDDAPPFDPTSTAALSEVTDLSLVDETPHLGLSLVARSVDELFYERRSEKNQLTLAKLIVSGPRWHKTSDDSAAGA